MANGASAQAWWMDPLAPAQSMTVSSPYTAQVIHFDGEQTTDVLAAAPIKVNQEVTLVVKAKPAT
jgi:hypothetical protein